LHKSLQSSLLNISTALELAEITIKQLIEMKSDSKVYDELLVSILEFADQNDIDRPSNSSRRGRRSMAEVEAKRQRIEIDPLEKYKELFCEILDVFIDHISDKFQSENYKPLIAISRILTEISKPDIGEMFFDLVIYRNEFDIDELDSELCIWYDFKIKNNLVSIDDIHKAFKEKNLKSIFPNIFTLLSIFLTVPISSAECERAFSCLKRLKTSLRSTIEQDRLSSLAVANINRNELINLDENILIEIFESCKNIRLEFF